MVTWSRCIRLGISLFGATLMGWTAVLLGYEIPCALGEHTRIDHPVIRAALRAESRVHLKERTSSHLLNRILHEVEEAKAFYRQI